MKEIDDNLSEECKKVADELIQALNEKGANAADLEILSLQHPDCESTLRQIFEAWDKLDDLEIPAESSDRRERFYKMLGDFEKEVDTGDRKTHSIQRFLMYPAIKWAAVLFIGVFIGVQATNYLDKRENGSANSEGYSILTSLESESSVERLSALQTIKGFDSPEDQVFEALFQTLTKDPNVNVRISTIGAILHFADQPKARAMLIKALIFQDSPIVQLTLAEVLIKLQEADAIEELQRLLKTDQFDNEVKMHLEETLRTL